MGPESDKIFQSLQFSVADGRQESDKNFETLTRKFDEYFVVKKSVIYKRSQFQNRKQVQGETVEEFYRALRDLVRHCEYQDAGEQIRDRLVVGLLDKKLQEKLQLISDLTLGKALEVARTHEQVKSQMRETVSADEARCLDPPTCGRGRGRNTANRGQRGRELSRGGRHKTEQQAAKCGRCGYGHGSNPCPAHGQKCNRCHKKGHFKKMCRSQIQSGIQEVVPDRDSENETDYLLDSVIIEDSQPWTVDLKIKDTVVNFKIDTGADISVMSDKSYRQLKRKPELSQSEVRLTSPGGRLTVRGEFYAKTCYKDTHYKFKVVVVENKVGNLLSRNAAIKMGLVKRLEEVHSDVFGSTGLLKTEPVSIKVKDGVSPYCVTTARRVPFPLQKKVKAEIERMVKDGIISEVTDPTDWCAPMVPVVKPDGKIRICVDFKRLNVDVKRPHCMLPNLNDIAPKMAGATVFSTLDAASGFFQVPLQEDSKKLTTFITRFRRYCFQRVPMGISLGPEVFQTKMKELLTGLDGCDAIMDDTIIYGKTLEEYDRNLEAVLTRIEESGLKLNKQKCHLRQSEVKFFGHIVSGSGVSPDPEKIRAIKDMPPPTSVSELRTVCGMLNYLTKFVSHMATTLKPVTDLLKGNRAWLWGPAQQQAFDSAKKKLSKSPALGFYDPQRQTVVSVDSSSYGLGATTMHMDASGQLIPIAYTSRTMTDAEKKYAQIEKECLATTWACEKFSKYLIGLDRFELQTDHKPLVPLIKTKDIDNVPVCCQRLLIRLMRFNADVFHVPGKEIVIADALSRSPVPHTAEDEEVAEVVTAYVNGVMDNQQITPRRIEALQSATVHDPELQQVISYILNGWPQSVAEQFQPYQQAQGELSVVDGLVIFNNRIVVPVSQRKDILHKLHETHQGLHKCRQNAQATVWWPGLSKELKNWSTPVGSVAQTDQYNNGSHCIRQSCQSVHGRNWAPTSVHYRGKTSS